MEKFEANKRRDNQKRVSLLNTGWRVLTVWECAMRGRTAWSMEEVVATVEAWLESSSSVGELGGRNELR
jgi:DNA mismatch endonuclease (patch repair protein)